MGIDIYARWPSQTEAETDAQRTGFSIEHGHVGYLREAYHVEPYATQVLVPEAFDRVAHPSGAPISAATLRERLPETLAAAFSDFVELCERKERETGQPCCFVASY